MRKLFALFGFFILCFNLEAQEKVKPEILFHKNYLTGYIGLLEYNINYERNLFLFPKSYSNIRIGLGEWSDLQGDGRIYNLTFVHLFGRKLSHIELNFGMNYINGKTKYGNFFYPIGFIGYRYEELKGKIIIRAGFSSWSFFNVGFGFKF